MKRLNCAIWLTLVCAFVALAGDDLPRTKPESVGMSAERLERIGAWLQELVASKKAAGFVSLVARRGKIVHHQAYGTLGLENPAPMTVDALFDLASMTKPITVAAALMLLEEGRFTVKEPVSTYLPEFKTVRVETAPGTFATSLRPISIEDLFTHTSGVFDSRSRGDKMNFPTLEAYVRELAKGPLRAQPGSSWIYGTSHDVLGRLVEVAGGMPLDRFVQARILDPLGMKDTHFWPPEDKSSRRAILVVNGKDDPLSLSRIPPDAGRAKTFMGGASGLYSSAADYWRFAQMLLNGGAFNGKRLLGPRTIAWMAQNHIGEMESFRTAGTRFGLGVAVVTDPGRAGMPYSKGTYYWSGSQGTIFWVDPVEDLVGVLMVQLTPSALQLRERLAAIVYSAIVE